VVAAKAGSSWSFSAASCAGTGAADKLSALTCADVGGHQAAQEPTALAAIFTSIRAQKPLLSQQLRHTNRPHDQLTQSSRWAVSL
jgi:hypothetical protein